MPAPPLVLPLPDDLRPAAVRLLAAEAANRQRRASRKRFALWVDPKDLGGFYAGGQPLPPEHDELRQLRPPENQETSSGPGTTIEDPDDSVDWLEFAAQLQQRADAGLCHDPHYAQLLADYRQTNQLPDWILNVGRRQAQPVFDVRQARPCKKHSQEVQAQSRWLARVRAVRPALAEFQVPLIPFQLPDSDQCFCIMPRLSAFVTLHDLLCSAAGFSVPHDPRVTAAELPVVLRQVAQQLAEILRYAEGPLVGAPTPADVTLQRLRWRFDKKHTVPVLLGQRLYEQLRDAVLHSAQQQLVPLLEPRRSRSIELAHGDLNATNIMVAIRRNAAGKIEAVCVRLIDPNPVDTVNEASFEVGRLLHWIELSLPLRLERERLRQEQTARSTSAPPQVTVDFGPLRPHLLDDWPTVRMGDALRAPLERTYGLFWNELRQALPWLNEPEAQARLSVAVGLFHLVSTKYLSERALDRTVAFLSGVDELQQGLGASSGGRRISEDGGLWCVRSPRRGRTLRAAPPRILPDSRN